MAEHPSAGYISDATVNNAEILYGAEPANMAALIDLINIVQSAVLNERLIASPLALRNSSLLQALDFAKTFEVREEARDGETVIDITAPWDLPPEDANILIDLDENGEPVASSGAGELLLAMAWSEMLQDDPILGSFVEPRNLADDQPRGEAYIFKHLAAMCWLMTDRGIMPFDSDEVREEFVAIAAHCLERYGLLARRLVSCSDRFGLDLTHSVLEAPLLGLSVAREVTAPLDWLEQFDRQIHDGIVAARADAFERWRFPAIGAVVLGRCKSLDDLPAETARAREALLKARNHVKAMNLELHEYERELEFGNDDHFAELNRIKVALQRTLETFGAETAYQAELEAFPVSERMWWIPGLVKSALGVMNAPVKTAADIAAMPWVRRQVFLRCTPGLKSAADYVNGVREPVMTRIIEGIAGADRDIALRQSQTLAFASDLVVRCTDLRPSDAIGDNVLFTMQDDDAGEVPVSENVFWRLMATSDQMREAFYPFAAA